jgi:hypothetical protein
MITIIWQVVLFIALAACWGAIILAIAIGKENLK